MDVSAGDVLHPVRHARHPQQLDLPERPHRQPDAAAAEPTAGEGNRPGDHALRHRHALYGV